MAQSSLGNQIEVIHTSEQCSVLLGVSNVASRTGFQGLGFWMFALFQHVLLPKPYTFLKECVAVRCLYKQTLNNWKCPVL